MLRVVPPHTRRVILSHRGKVRTQRWHVSLCHKQMVGNLCIGLPACWEQSLVHVRVQVGVTGVSVLEDLWKYPYLLMAWYWATVRFTKWSDLVQSGQPKWGTLVCQVWWSKVVRVLLTSCEDQDKYNKYVEGWVMRLTEVNRDGIYGTSLRLTWVFMSPISSEPFPFPTSWSSCYLHAWVAL